MARKLLNLMYLVLVGAIGAASDPAAIFQSSGYAPSSVGFLVLDAGTGAVVAAHNSEKLFIPASVTKCVTAAAALDLLGLDYRFKTNIYVGGAFEADSGIVKGNLYIKGGGDPGFLAERLWLLAQHLKHRGIHRIDGDIVVDGSFFDTSRVGPGFDEDKSSRAYEAPVAALSASFNTLAVHCRPGASIGSPVHVDLFPAVGNIPVTVSARTTAPGIIRGVTVESREQGELTAIEVTGAMAMGAQPRYFYRRIWNATDHFGYALFELLNESGVVIHGKVRSGLVPEGLAAKPPFYEFDSQPLTEFIGHMFKYSSNFAAEMLFRTIAAERGARHQGSWVEGREIMRAWWHDTGLPDTLRIVNGSGMGSDNRLTPAQVSAVLMHVLTRNDYWPDYLSALSNAGLDGTLKDRFSRSPLKGKIRGKTGTLNSVGASSLAGYVLDGTVRYVFTIFVNNRQKGQFEHWALQQRILEDVIVGSK